MLRVGTMQCSLVAGATFAIGCLGALGCLGSPPRESTTPSMTARIALEQSVAEQVWYRATSICGQGPYEIEVPIAGARWGEEIELRLATPRRIALHAVIVADDAEAVKDAAVYAAHGKADGKAENTRCVADVRERLAASRGGPGPGGPAGPPVETGIRVRPPGEPPPREVTVTGQLELDRGEPPASIEIVRHGWRHRERGEVRRFGRIRIRLWSIEPNDLEGVRFGVRRIVWRPNVTDAEYEAHLGRIAAEEEARRLRQQEELEARRLRQEEELRRRIAEDEERRRRQPPPPPRRTTVVEVDSKAELERYRQQEEERRRRAAELAAEAERRRRAAELAAVAEAERLRKRQEFCASHPEDRGCWGAGGLRVHLQLDERERERERYCAAHREDARCWSKDDRWRRELVWRKRVQVATAPPKQPDGPPPDARAETIPPKLSVNANWLPGYWHWSGTGWAWLGGMWRVPESDIVAERTTTAPEAPPPLQSEAPPPPPMAATIWVSGFWQWNGRVWVWVPGSWQMRPDAGSSWRPAEWKTRGTVHVLIPGGWIRVRGGRR